MKLKIGDIVYSKEWGYGVVSDKYDTDFPFDVNFMGYCQQSYLEDGAFFYDPSAHPSGYNVEKLRFQLLAKLLYPIHKMAMDILSRIRL